MVVSDQPPASAPAQVPAPAPVVSWDEAQCKAGLAQLERLQALLDNVRLNIHRIVQPLSDAPVTSNTELYAAYSDAVKGSGNNLTALRTQWQSPEVQSTLDHTNASFAANSDLSAGAQLPRYGWTSGKGEAAIQDLDSHKKVDAEVPNDAPALTPEEIGRILDDFRKANPVIKIDTKDDNREVKLKFVAGGLKLQFRVTINLEANAKEKLTVTCDGTAAPFVSINKCVASRPRPMDLKYLLDMIAAYKTVKGDKCAKCGNLLDKNAQAAMARRSKESTSQDGSKQLIWQALHENCVD